MDRSEFTRRGGWAVVPAAIARGRWLEAQHGAQTRQEGREREQVKAQALPVSTSAAPEVRAHSHRYSRNAHV